MEEHTNGAQPVLSQYLDGQPDGTVITWTAAGVPPNGEEVVLLDDVLSEMSANCEHVAPTAASDEASRSTGTGPCGTLAPCRSTCS
jgi:hypothetical protein